MYQRIEPILRTSQILGIISCVLVVVGVLLILIDMILDRMFVHLIPGTMFLSFVMMLSCVSVFTSYRVNQASVNDTYGWSYVIGWLSVVVSLCSFIIAFIVERISVGDDYVRSSTLTFGWKPVSSEPNSYVTGLSYR